MNEWGSGFLVTGLMHWAGKDVEPSDPPDLCQGMCVPHGAPIPIPNLQPQTFNRGVGNIGII